MTECKKCGTIHNMVLTNMETGEKVPLEVCEDCMFVIKPITEQVHLTTEWGGSLNCIVDGKVKNMAEHLSETESKIIGQLS